MKTEKFPFVPYETEPRSVPSAIVQIIEAHKNRIEPRSENCWIYNIRKQIPGEWNIPDGVESSILVPVDLPGLATGQVYDGENLLGHRFMQTNSGLIISQRVTDRLGLEEPIISYEPRRKLWIMEPETLAKTNYFVGRVKNILEARVTKKIA